MLAGVPFFDEVFRQLDCSYVLRLSSLSKRFMTWTQLMQHLSVKWHIKEGESFEPITKCATVSGPVRKILLGERVALNILARCSGIATK